MFSILVAHCLCNVRLHKSILLEWSTRRGDLALPTSPIGRVSQRAEASAPFISNGGDEDTR
jgi:hypothetical protein